MLSPITYTEAVVGDFLRYQLTTYPFADPGLHAQMRALLGLETTRQTPLLEGPYISLSQAFRQGAALADLVAEGILHPHLPRLASHNAWGHARGVWRHRIELAGRDHALAPLRDFREPGQLAQVYGFTDLDGSQPDCWRYLAEVQDAGKPADVTGYR
jgi:hypothetical protein